MTGAEALKAAEAQRDDTHEAYVALLAQHDLLETECARLTDELQSEGQRAHGQLDQSNVLAVENDRVWSFRICPCPAPVPATSHN